MESRMPKFREFVSKYPKLREEVRSGNKTWQSIYEEWVIYGENDNTWKKYQEQEQNNVSFNLDSIKNVVNYIRKINPDDLNKTLNTVQKVLQIAQTVTSKGAVAPIASSTYSDWWD